MFYRVKCGTIPPFKWFNSIITLIATVLTPILAVAAYDGWKKQHIINQQEAIIVRVLDQLDRVDVAAKDYFKPIHISTVINDSEKYKNEISSSNIQLIFELKKLETLLEKTKEIDFICSNKGKNNVIEFEELVDKHYEYLKLNTEPFPEEDKEFKKALLKNNEANLFISFGKINIKWNDLSNDIRSIVLGWSGSKLLSNMEETKSEPFCVESTYDHDKYAKEIFERSFINLN
ncbi:hypothetical protein [Acinetobacter gyllenbergii]|uniref:hypothetical protein n=1 Tax=Acinetobacter gyllenbergii TaxID=134534 RepID=UPI0008069701|nr:hypothetical protein [Acinetobacter gyllenbergii]OBY74233.1 hypothetical protein NG55_10380 [Acinetobacter gyllenbergii]